MKSSLSLFRVAAASQTPPPLKSQQAASFFHLSYLSSDSSGRSQVWSNQNPTLARVSYTSGMYPHPKAFRWENQNSGASGFSTEVGWSRGWHSKLTEEPTCYANEPSPLILYRVLVCLLLFWAVCFWALSFVLGAGLKPSYVAEDDLQFWILLPLTSWVLGLLECTTTPALCSMGAWTPGLLYARQALCSTNWMNQTIWVFINQGANSFCTHV